MSTVASLIDAISTAVTAHARVVSDAANIIAVACVVPLCVLTLRRITRPSPVTWSLWAAVGVIAAGAMAAGGAPAAAWTLKLALSIGPAAIAVCAVIARVPWRMGRWDHVCLGIGVAGCALYAWTGDGLFAVWFSIAINIIGTVPTVMHAWREPWRESVFPFTCAAVSVTAVLLTIPLPWTAIGVTYPLYLLVDTALIVVVILVARRRPRPGWHILVTPAPDEARRIDADRVAAGYRWLARNQRIGILREVEAFPETGGYMVVNAPGRLIDDDARVWLADLLDTYPLHETITAHGGTSNIRELTPRLRDGFGVLDRAVRDAEATRPAAVRDPAQ